MAKTAPKLGLTEPINTKVISLMELDQVRVDTNIMEAYIKVTSSGLYHGHGRYYYADSGRTYEGQFANNHPSGRGVMAWSDGSRYEGTFLKGKMEGSGT